MPTKVSFEFDPFELAGVQPPKKRASEAKAEIAKFLAEQIVADVGDGRSPIAGGKWKKSLSKEYKARKVAQGGNSYADMILDGDMLLAFDVKSRKGTTLEAGVFGSKQAAKADGHNNHSGKSSLPLREFIPKEGQTFRAGIIDGIRKIAARYTHGESDEAE